MLLMPLRARARAQQRCYALLLYYYSLYIFLFEAMHFRRFDAIYSLQIFSFFRWIFIAAIISFSFRRFLHADAAFAFPSPPFSYFIMPFFFFFATPPPPPFHAMRDFAQLTRIDVRARHASALLPISRFAFPPILRRHSFTSDFLRSRFSFCRCFHAFARQRASTARHAPRQRMTQAALRRQYSRRGRH